MKRLVTWIPIVACVVLAVAWLAHPRGGADRDQPDFKPPQAPSFEPIATPFGTSRLSGRVLDASGAPLADVAIFARSGEVPHWTFTDAEGRFRLEELAPEKLEVHVLAWKHDSQSFELTPGDAEQTLKLAEALADPERLAELKRAKFAGHVEPASELGAELVLVPRDPPEVLQGAVPRRVRIADDGTFAIEDLALGSYRAIVVPEWASGSTSPNLVDPRSASVEHTGEQAALAIALASGVIRGRVENRDGSPLGGAWILLSTADAAARPFPAATSKEDGTFELRGVPSGDYQLELRAGDDVHVEPALRVDAAKPTELAPVRLDVHRETAKSESKP